MRVSLDIFFARYRWYRRKRGGHWELWRNSVTCSLAWVRMPLGCSFVSGDRPPCCFELWSCDRANP
jgi:hypothetical protein